MSKIIGKQGINGMVNYRPYSEQYVCPSESGDKDYIVTHYADGPFENKQNFPYSSLNDEGKCEWACSCIGWTRHYPRQDCKHIRYAQCGGATTLSDAIANKLEGVV